MVRRDVRDDARLVRLVADAAEQDPAARGLEDRDVEVVALEDRLRAAAARSSRRARPSSSRRRSRRTSSRRPACPASRRMWAIRRVVVVLPFVPLIETIGSRRSASRIHAGPGPVRLADPRERRARPGGACRGVSRSMAPAGMSRSTSARAISAIAVARSPSAHGQTTIQCPGSDDRWTATPGRPRRRDARGAAAGPSRRATRRAPGWRDRGTVAESRTSACRSGSRRPYQVRRRPIADLDLHRRLEPVQVRTVEEADLDEAHGPARIATARRRATLDFPRDHRSRRRARASPTPSWTQLQRDRRGRPAGVPRRPRAAVQHRLRQLLAAGRQRGRDVGRRGPRAAGRPRRAAAGPERPVRRHRRRDVRGRARAPARASC